MTLDERIERMMTARDAMSSFMENPHPSPARALVDVVDELLTLLRERREDEVAASR